jgi:protein phosphatase
MTGRAAMEGRELKVLDSDLRTGFKLSPVDELMPIGVFSEQTGLTPKRLRTYAANGLLQPAAIDSTSGYRYYSPGQLRDARLIEALRSAGMPLAEVALLLLDRSSGRLDQWAQEVEAEATQRHEALDLARHLLALEVDLHTLAQPRQEGTQVMMKTAGYSDQGLVRAHNEDTVVSRDDLAVVTDGMGGAPGGEVASAVAAALVESAFTKRSIDELTAATRAANRAIWDRASVEPDLEGMGTTLCAIGLLENDQLAVVNVGDSRVYRLRAGSLWQLTDDHSISAEMMRRGEISKDEASAHPHRHVLTRALGVGPSVEVDATIHSVTDGDRYLVCTDGLFNELLEDEMASLLVTDDLAGAARGLVELAVARGGNDNVSAVVAEVRK